MLHTGRSLSLLIHSCKSTEYYAAFRELRNTSKHNSFIRNFWRSQEVNDCVSDALQYEVTPTMVRPSPYEPLSLKLGRPVLCGVCCLAVNSGASFDAKAQHQCGNAMKCMHCSQQANTML